MTRIRFPVALPIAAITVLTGALLTLASVVPPASSGRKTEPARAAARITPQWTGTWAASPQEPGQSGFRNVTLRLIVHTTIGGSGTRIRLANTFGTTPLHIGAATVGIQSAGAAIEPGTLRPLTFNGGQPEATVAPGAQLTSDGVPEHVPADANLAISLYLPSDTGPPTEHGDGDSAHQISYISTAGDHVGALTASRYPESTVTWFFLDGVDVKTPGASAIVTLGDSITDGTRSSNDTNHRYPDWLFNRLQAAGGPYARFSVLNAGIGGDELLRTSACCRHNPSALARLGTDVLGQSGVRDVIVLLGTNDILGAHHATASAVIAGLRQLITQARARGLRVFGGTITPSSKFTPAENRTRAAVNHWILTSGAYNGVIDFAAAVADPADPDRLNPAYSSWDHLHPNDAGYQAMADAVNLAMLLGGGEPSGERS